MNGKKDEIEIEFEIKKDFPEFDKEKFLTQTKWVIPILYNDLKNNNYHKTKLECKEDLIYQLLEEKEKFRITKNMDHIIVQYAKLYDYIKENDEIFVKVYTSVYFYDNVKNNMKNENLNDKYWNDIWIITYRDKGSNKNKGIYNCENCGATMKYNKLKELFECNYCHGIMFANNGMDWEIVDIEVKE